MGHFEVTPCVCVVIPVSELSVLCPTSLPEYEPQIKLRAPGSTTVPTHTCAMFTSIVLNNDRNQCPFTVLEFNALVASPLFITHTNTIQ